MGFLLVMLLVVLVTTVSMVSPLLPLVCFPPFALPLLLMPTDLWLTMLVASRRWPNVTRRFATLLMLLMLSVTPLLPLVRDLPSVLPCLHLLLFLLPITSRLVSPT